MIFQVQKYFLLFELISLHFGFSLFHLIHTFTFNRGLQMGNLFLIFLLLENLFQFVDKESKLYPIHSDYLNSQMTSGQFHEHKH